MNGCKKTKATSGEIFYLCKRAAARAAVRAAVRVSARSIPFDSSRKYSITIFGASHRWTTWSTSLAAYFQIGINADRIYFRVRPAARAAAPRDASWAAARDAAWDVVWDVALAAAWDVALDVAWAAALSAERAAARERFNSMCMECLSA